MIGDLIELKDKNGNITLIDRYTINTVYAGAGLVTFCLTSEMKELRVACDIEDVVAELKACEAKEERDDEEWKAFHKWKADKDTTTGDD